MITGLVGSGSITVSGGYCYFPSYSMNPSNPLVGMMRHNSSSNCNEVFDGSAWITVNTAVPTIQLTPVTEKAIAWAAAQMEKDTLYRSLASEYPAIKDLLTQQDEIRQKIDMIVTLVKNTKQNGTS